MNTETGNRPKKNGSQNMMYEQQMRFLPAGSKDKLVELIETKLRPKKYAVIIHDKDVKNDGTPAEPHIHAMLCFSNARSWANVAKILGDKPQQVQYWDNRVENGMSYLLHATKGAQSKCQYDPSEVSANFDFPAEYARITGEVEKAKKQQDTKVPFLLDALYAGVMTKDEVEARLSGSQYARYHRQIDDVWNKRLQNLAAQWREDMMAQNKKIRTIWFYGDAGTGKTSMAREQAQKAKQEYYISGSSRDIFQTYKGQHTLILDELRPHVMEYQDLLRITDPFGLAEGVMAPSRYFDKPLACDLIFITSPYDPVTFYKKQLGVEYNPCCSSAQMMDKFDQLLRRISVTIMMTQEHIYIAEYDVKYQRYIPVLTSERPNPYSSTARPASVSNPMDLYESMFT